MDTFRNAAVAVFGLGGVGGHCAEALARLGIGKLILIDNDVISESNINRQLFATTLTIGKKKTDAAAERIRTISDCELTLFDIFYDGSQTEEIFKEAPNFIIDAIDTVSAKLALIQSAKEAGIPILSSMGTGDKKNPSLLQITDIKKTSVCPLARVMRRELKKRGIDELQVCFSAELPERALNLEEAADGRRDVPSSNPFVPASAGLLLASEAARVLASKNA